MKRRPKLVLKRLGLALLSLVGLLVVLEIALQLTHLCIRPTSSRNLKPQTRNLPIILCLGDSHTYGAGVSVEDSYPVQLAGKLKARGCEVNVVNMGAPGINTSQVRRRLPQWLNEHRPKVVIVLACVNNCWNIMDADWSDMQEGLPVPFRRRLAVSLQSNLRTVRAAAIVYRRLTMSSEGIREYVLDRRGAGVLHRKNNQWKLEGERRRLAIAGMERALRDLKAIVHLIRAADAAPILMTYAARTDDNFSDQNLGLRHTAAAMNVALADNDKAMRPLFTKDDGAIDEQVFGTLFKPDLHLAPRGYDKVSDNIVKVLEESGLLDRLGHQNSRTVNSEL